jgi:hypothetical protein
MSKIQQTQQTHAQTAAKANKPQQAQQKSFNPAQLFESPESMRSEDVLAAQQTVGNQVVQRALDKDDRRKGLTDNQGNLRQDLNEQIQQKRGGGSPLPENIQKEASQKLGRSFKDVRIHTDESADKLSRTISARAFTIGKDIFFKNGVFAPGSGAGRETIMHELTHVVQQGGRSSASGALKLGAPDTAHEKEADRIGKKHAASVGAAPAGAVQREGEEDELMMQGIEEEELQMQEEEELQMQEEEEELQMQEDDDIAEDAPAESPDDLMMQGEEEELQMQSDSVGVLQRNKDDDWDTDSEPEPEKPISREEMQKLSSNFFKQMKAPSNPEIPAPELPAPKKPVVNIEDNEEINPRARLELMLNQKGKAKQAKQDSLGKVTQKAKSMKLGSDEHMKRLQSLEDRGQKSLKTNYKSEQKAGTSGFLNESIKKKKEEEAKSDKAKKESGAKDKWEATLTSGTAKAKDVEKAKERLKKFYPDEYKDDKAFESKDKVRFINLKAEAQKGNDEAFEMMTAEEKAKDEASFGGKAKKFASKAVSKVWGGVKNIGKQAGTGLLKSATGGITSGINQFGGSVFGKIDFGKAFEGKDDDKKDDDKKKSGGMDAIMEKYAETLQENKKLKEQLAALKGA